MLGQTRGFAILMALGLLALSCSEIPEEPASGAAGDMAIEQMPDSRTIPAAWGNLVSAEISPSSRFVWMWLQDEAGTIRMVSYDHRTGRYSAAVRVMRRGKEVER